MPHLATVTIGLAVVVASFVKVLFALALKPLDDFREQRSALPAGRRSIAGEVIVIRRIKPRLDRGARLG